MSTKLWPGLIAAGAGAMMAIALYMQHVMGLEPCPLCMMQRVWLSTAGIIALLAFLHDPKATGQRVYATLSLLACLVGAGFSIRQLYLQSLPPDQVPACGPGLDYMLQNFPFKDVLHAMINGTGDCAKVDWSLFGVSIAGYLLLGFIGLSLIAVVQWRGGLASRHAWRRATPGIAPSANC